MPNQAEAHIPEATYEPVPAPLTYATPLKRLEREPKAKNTRGAITSLFDIAVSPGSVELTPSNFRDLPPELRTAALNGVAELRETFSNDVFGEFPITAQVHSILVEDMPASFQERTGRRMNGMDRVIVAHQPNMTASAIYYPTTGQFMTSIKEHRTSDFPTPGSRKEKSARKG